LGGKRRRPSKGRIMVGERKRQINPKKGRKCQNQKIRNQEVCKDASGRLLAVRVKNSKLK